MDFTLNEDHEQIRKSVRSFLDRSGSESDVRRISETAEGFDRGAWATLSKQLGLPGLGVPEQLGGSGFGFAELCVVVEEMGAALYPNPLFATRVLALEALLLSEDPAVADQVAALASGEALGTLAVSAHPGGWRDDRVSVHARSAGDGHVLDGQVSFVVDGAVADVVVVAAELDGTVALFVVDSSAPGLQREPLRTVDLTRHQARLTFGDCPARRIACAGGVSAVLSAVLDRAAIALAAEQVGGAQRCLDMAVAYAKTRVQFGRPIGSFQAIKHKCANVLLELDAARSAVRAAAWSVDHAAADVPVLASLLKAHCSEMYELAARECIQIHGGMGFTWEFGAQLYFKRAHSSALMFGTPDHHREVLAQRLGLEATTAVAG